MQKFLLILSIAFFTLTVTYLYSNKDTGMTKPNIKNETIVVLKTSLGDITVELYPEKAPETVKNFLKYVDEGHYEQTIFHRVIENFMIQGGGFTSNMQQKPTHAPVINEAGNGLLNKRGTIAMARTSDVNSATSQFFINTVDNPFLNYRGDSPHEFGYCVFGKVIDGMDIVDEIKVVDTKSQGPYQDFPVKPVVILKVLKKQKEVS